MQGIHFVSHRTQLAVRELSHLPVISRIENLLEKLYNYFARSPKRHMEFTKLAGIMQTKGLKIIRNVKTCWLSMLSPLKRVMSEYQTLVHKMHEDSMDSTTTHISRESAKANYDLLVDISIPIALACFLPLLETVHCLVKFSQERDIFICDYLAAVKVYQLQLYQLYQDPGTCFKSDAFREMTDLISCKHSTISMQWMPTDMDLNEVGMEYLAYQCKDSYYPATMIDASCRVHKVTWEAFTVVVDDVKLLCQSMPLTF
jgi:hypothetical protein